MPPKKSALSRKTSNALRVANARLQENTAEADSRKNDDRIRYVEKLPVTHFYLSMLKNCKLLICTKYTYF